MIWSQIYSKVYCKNPMTTAETMTSFLDNVIMPGSILLLENAQRHFQSSKRTLGTPWPDKLTWQPYSMWNSRNREITPLPPSLSAQKMDGTRGERPCSSHGDVLWPNRLYFIFTRHLYHCRETVWKHRTNPLLKSECLVWVKDTSCASVYKLLVPHAWG